MKRLIWLLPYDYNPDDKKLKQSEEDRLIAKMSSDCFKQFKQECSAYSYITCSREYPGKYPSILITFPDDKIPDVYNEFVRSIGGVDVIDNVLPIEEQEGRTKEEKLAAKNKPKELDLSKFMK